MNARYAISDTLDPGDAVAAPDPAQPGPADRLHAAADHVHVAVRRTSSAARSPTPGYDDYADFLIPGIIVQQMSFGGFATALGLVDDLKKGLVDRFRSLPMSRMAVLTGRTLSDIAMNALALTVMVVVGYIVGFSFSTSPAEVVGGIALCLLIGYAFSWVFACVGLLRLTRPRRQTRSASSRSSRSRSPPRRSCRRRHAPTGCRPSPPTSTRSRSWSTRSARCSSAARPATTCGARSSGASG